MSKDLNHLKAQLNAITELRAWIATEIAELEAPKVEKWEPDGGEFYVTASGDAANYKTDHWRRKFGVERKTYDQAINAAKRMRTFNRLDAWIDENTDGCLVDCKVELEGNRVVVVCYMPVSKVFELAKLMNDGVVVL